MGHRGFVVIAVTAIVVGTLSGSVACQASETAQSAPAAWTPPQTPWGEPDLQGVWRHEGVTPLERPKQFAEREFLTDQEVAQREQAQRDLLAKKAAGADGETVGRRPLTESPIEGNEYNSFWGFTGRLPKVSRRTSLVVEPSNGQIPYTLESRERQAYMNEVVSSRPPDDFVNRSWVDRDTGERCITDGVIGEMWRGTGPNLIVQGQGYVVFIHEQWRDRRIVPTDGRPHGTIGRWLGDSVGRWEGDTLVVDTINFLDKTHYNWRRVFQQPTPDQHLVERWTPVGPGAIDYAITITDATLYTEAWKVQVPLTKLDAPFFEYACHEGNYAMVHLLSQERNLEKEKARKTGQPRSK